MSEIKIKEETEDDNDYDITDNFLDDFDFSGFITPSVGAQSCQQQRHQNQESGPEQNAEANVSTLEIKQEKHDMYDESHPGYNEGRSNSRETVAFEDDDYMMSALKDPRLRQLSVSKSRSQSPDHHHERKRRRSRSSSRRYHSSYSRDQNDSPPERRHRSRSRRRRKSRSSSDRSLQSIGTTSSTGRTFGNSSHEDFAQGFKEQDKNWLEKAEFGYQREQQPEELIKIAKSPKKAPISSVPRTMTQASYSIGAASSAAGTSSATSTSEPKGMQPKTEQEKVTLPRPICVKKEYSEPLRGLALPRPILVKTEKPDDFYNFQSSQAAITQSERPLFSRSANTSASTNTVLSRREQVLRNCAAARASLKPNKNNEYRFVFTPSLVKIKNPNEYAEFKSPLNRIDNLPIVLSSTQYGVDYKTYGRAKLSKKTSNLCQRLGYDVNKLAKQMKTLSHTLSEDVTENAVNANSAYDNFFTTNATQTEPLNCNECLARKIKIYVDRNVQTEGDTSTPSNNQFDNQDLPLMATISTFNASQLLALNDFADLIRAPIQTNAADLFRVRENLLQIYNSAGRLSVPSPMQSQFAHMPIYPGGNFMNTPQQVHQYQLQQYQAQQQQMFFQGHTQQQRMPQGFETDPRRRNPLQNTEGSPSPLSHAASAMNRGRNPANQANTGRYRY